MELDKKERELVEYAFETVRALGITDGPVHGEYMIDEKGPVLIEVNCRAMGGSAPVDYLDKVFGYHETDVILESMLDSDYHSEFLKRTYRPLRKGYVKDFYSDMDKPISSSGIIPIVLNLRSYNSGWLENAGKTSFLHETVDLETETGCVYLVHDDPEVTKKDFELLMLIEEKYPNLLHSDSPLFIPPEKNEDITPQIRETLEKDTESLITDIIAFYRNGAKGEPIVPEALLESNPYNREVMELLGEIAGSVGH
jgi:hypothetical protein